MELDQAGQVAKARLEDMKQRKAAGGMISDAMLADAERAYAFAVGRAQAIERAYQAQEAQGAAERARAAAFWEQRRQKEEETLKDRARLVWRGTPEAFEQSWPTMYQLLLERETMQQVETMAATAPTIRL